MREFILSLFTLERVQMILLYIEIFFLIYLLGYSTFQFISVVSGGHELFENIKKRELRSETGYDDFIPISIIVPAYNEEVTIVETIRSLLSLDYSTYEIIIVNDGSRDNTLNTVIESFHLELTQKPIKKLLECSESFGVYEQLIFGKVLITLIDKKNGGKADAINMGINASNYPYFVCMDADSILQTDSLKKIAIPVLENPLVVAVGSMIRISNDSTFEHGKPKKMMLPKKIIPALQVLEYERSFLASRILLDKFNANLIISGAFGLFKKEAVLNVGGYQVGSMGEDMELIVKLHSYYRTNRLAYQIRYSYEAVCWTQVPEQLKDLMKQRRRWHIGLYQSLMRHRNLLSTGSYIYYLVYELLSPVIELGGLFAVLLANLYGLVHLGFMFQFYLVYVLFGSVLTVISFLTRNFLTDTKITFRDTMRVILLCVPENIIFRFVLAWTRILALVFYRWNKANWGAIKRVSIKYNP